MEVLGLLLALAALAFAFFLLAGVVTALGFVLYLFWPAIAGVFLGLFLGFGVDDNLGVIVAIGCFVGQYFWSQHIDDGGSTYDPMSGKKKHYDSDGNVKGYSDKE